MHRKLLSGTAVVAVGSLMLPAAAAAEEKLSLGVGGYFQGYFAAVSQDDGVGEPGANRRSHQIAREAEVHFVGETMLDNGLSFGVAVELEAETCGDQIDESYVYVQGGWGRLELGAQDPVTETMFIGAPNAIAGVRLADANFTFSQLPNALGTPDIIANMSGNSEKISYFTPRIAGFQLGASYTPDRCEEGGCGGTYSGTEPDNDVNQQSEIIELAVTYVQTFGEVEAGLYGSYGAANVEAPTAGIEDREIWGVGASLAYAGFTLGAAYTEDNLGTSGSNTDRKQVSLGVRYKPGVWDVGVEYFHGEVGEGAGLGDDETDAVQLGLGYELGPGVRLEGGVTFWDVKDNLGDPASENQAIDFVVGTIVKF